jgi:hypothetical protein
MHNNIRRNAGNRGAHHLSVRYVSAEEFKPQIVFDWCQ